MNLYEFIYSLAFLFVGVIGRPATQYLNDLCEKAKQDNADRMNAQNTRRKTLGDFLELINEYQVMLEEYSDDKLQGRELAQNKITALNTLKKTFEGYYIGDNNNIKKCMKTSYDIIILCNYKQATSYIANNIINNKSSRIKPDKYKTAYNELHKRIIELYMKK